MATFTLKRKESTIATIASEKRTPIQGAPIGAPVDAKVQGLMFYNECMALQRSTFGTWTTLAHKCFALSVEARSEFISHVNNGLKGMRGEVARANYDGDEKGKGPKREVSSATVQVSRMRRIATAANKGASMAGLGAFYGVKDPEHIGYNRVYDYVVAFLRGAAANKPGRPAKLLVAKCAGWLANATKGANKTERTKDMIATDKGFREALEALIAEWTPETATTEGDHE